MVLREVLRGNVRFTALPGHLADPEHRLRMIENPLRIIGIAGELLAGSGGGLAERHRVLHRDLFQGLQAIHREARAGHVHRAHVDGEQLRDFIYVMDVVNVIVWLMEHKPASAIYNLGTGQARTFIDLTKATFAAMGIQPVINFRDTPEDIRDKYQYFTEARMDRVRAAGFQGQSTPLEEGVRRYVQSFLATPDPYR